MIHSSAYTFEEYATLFSRIEAILNSRPLCASTSDPTIDYLTPGHFLIGCPLVAAPENFVLNNKSPGTRWEHLKQLHQAFWKRWHREYLHTVMTRAKWTKPSQPLAVGDIVFLTGGSTNPLNWPMGRISQLLPGADGVVRVVTIRTVNGTFTRPVSKLILLPLA